MIWGSYKVYKSVSNGGGVSFRGGWLYYVQMKNATYKTTSVLAVSSEPQPGNIRHQILYHFDRVFMSRITNGFELNTYGTVMGHNS